MQFSEVYRPLCWVAVIGLIAVGFSTPSVQSAPQPSVIPSAWELDFTYQVPRLIWIKLPGKESASPFWYISYNVTNNTGSEAMWVPQTTIYTNRGRMIQAGKGVPPIVFEKIKDELKNPLLLSPIDAVGKIRRGEDQAIDSVFIWPASKEDVDRVQVFIGGLSGETTRVPVPGSDETVLVRKTRMLQFDMPGTPADIVRKPVKLEADTWVMR